MVGDASGAMTFGLEGASVLGALRYSRQYEEQADREGMRMLVDSRIDPTGMIKFFEMIKKDDEKFPAVPTYLSTHPSPESRITALKLLASQSRVEPIKLLPGCDWQNIRSICQAAGRKKS
jgi:predicted Zn-dependent protease